MTYSNIFGNKMFYSMFVKLNLSTTKINSIVEYNFLFKWLNIYTKLWSHEEAMFIFLIQHKYVAIDMWEEKTCLNINFHCPLYMPCNK